MNAPSADAVEFDPGSFRDRTGRVFFADGQVYRGLNAEALSQWAMLEQREFFRRYTAEGKLVDTRRVDSPGRLGQDEAHVWQGVLHHERIPFVSYPYEWSFGMLREAALLQLELLAAALDEGMILKDASPYNIQWQGSRSVFIDIPSFVAYEPGSPWVGYRQFCQLFLYPLFCTAYKGLPFHPWLRGSIAGIEPSECWSMMSLRDLFRGGVFSHVYLHHHLQHRYSASHRNLGGEMREAGFGRELIRANVRGLQRLLGKLRWRAARSEWSDYDTANVSYREGELVQKETFVRRAAASRRWRLAWDLGANTGRFSRIVAEQSDYVVAMDRDCLAVERMYQQLKQEGNSRILPLIMDLADPSVNRGWRGLERKSITNRSQPELVLCLALVHHLVITAHIPLDDFVRWLAELRAEIVFEFVTRDDPMVQRLLRFRGEQFPEYDQPVFERCADSWFETLAKETLPGGTRVLYHLRPRSAAK